MARRGRGQPPPGGIIRPDRQLAFPGLGELLAQVRPPTPPGAIPQTDAEWEKFDPEDLFDRLVAANMDSSTVSVDEVNDMARPRNVVEWVLDARFLAQEPYPKQLEVLLAAREDYCPLCSDVKWLRCVPTDARVDDILERAQLLDHGVCPKCKKDRRDFKAQGLFHHPNELILVTGQRSGKTTVIAYDWSYSLEEFLGFPDPSRSYRVIKGQLLQSLFCAITAKQAYETLWAQAMAVYDNAPWFQQLARLLVQKGREVGRQLYQREKTFVAFWHKNIVCTFGPAEGGSQRGRSRFYCAVDEWGWFAKSAVETRKKIRGNEDDIYTALTRSLLTIRSGGDRLREANVINAPTGFMANIGSPYSLQDKGMRLLREREKNPRAVCRHYSTFEMNPTIRPEDIDPMELESADGQRDYYAIPPMAADPYIEDPEFITASMDLNRPTLLAYTTEVRVEQVRGTETLRRYVYAKIKHWPRDRFVARVLALDAGERYASFAGVLAHVDRELRTVIDGAIEVQPLPHHAVHFPSMFEHVVDFLVSQLNIRFIVADRWQSTDLIQRARTLGVQADQRTLKPTDFRDFKGRLIAGKTRMAAPEIDPVKLAELEPRDRARHPNAHLALQTMTVRKIGEKVTKPESGFDDLFRCLVLADVVVEDHRREMAAEVDEHGMPRLRTVGIVSGLSDNYGVAGPVDMRRGSSIGVVGRYSETRLFSRR